jgi:hypothetical protein
LEEPAENPQTFAVLQTHARIEVDPIVCTYILV